MDIHNQHYWGDPSAAPGAWGKSTSTAKQVGRQPHHAPSIKPVCSRTDTSTSFCEDDYAVTHYIAEFINSLSNFAFIYLALRHPHKPGRRPSSGLDVMSWALLILGINSFLFHATMRHGMQYCDELSMLLLSGGLLHGAFTINQTTATKSVINGIILILFTVSSAIYLKTENIFHQVAAFDSMCLVFGARLAYLVCVETDGTKRRSVLKDSGAAVGVLVLGYLLWQFDLEECVWLRGVKEQVGLPWSWLLELHGWWHVFTALAASKFMRIVRQLTP